MRASSLQAAAAEAVAALRKKKRRRHWLACLRCRCVLLSLPGFARSHAQKQLLAAAQRRLKVEDARSCHACARRVSARHSRLLLLPLLLAAAAPVLGPTSGSSSCSWRQCARARAPVVASAAS